VSGRRGEYEDEIYDSVTLDVAPRFLYVFVSLCHQILTGGTCKDIAIFCPKCDIDATRWYLRIVSAGGAGQIAQIDKGLVK